MNIREFVSRMATIQIDIKRERERALDRIGKLVADEAKSEFGTYQGPEGNQLPGWAPLSPNTLGDWHGFAGKESLGYAPPDNPLVRDGEQRDSIQHTVESDREVVIGSDLKRMVYSELGTENEPARSTLARATIRKTDEILDIAAEATLGGFAGGGPKIV